MSSLNNQLYAQPTFSQVGYSFTNNTTDPITGEVWTSGTITNLCSGNYIIEYSLSASGTPALEYQVNSGGWNSLGASPATINTGASSTLEFRLLVTALPVDEIVTMDITAYEPINLNENKTNITCFGLADGTITITPSCGEDANYSFSWTTLPTGFPDPGNTGAISGLIAGEYQVSVSNASGGSAMSSLITITEPSEALSFVVTGQNWSCSSGVGCNGSITVTPGGGTQPYTISLNGVPDDSPFTALCAGNYTVSVTDANSCPVADQNFIISTDNAPPTCLTYPDASVLINIASYNPVARLDTAHFVAVPTAFIGGESDTIVYGLDASLYNNLQLKITAHQTDNPGAWTNTDSLQVSYSLDGNVWTALLTDFCNWTASETPEAGPCDGNTTPTENSTWIDLPNSSGVNSLSIRIITFTGGAGRYYTLDALKVRYNSTTAAVTAALSGQPSDCSDPNDYTPPAGIRISPKDTLLHWFCNQTGNLEFKFRRIWEIIDNCNNKTRFFQDISVGTAPDFASVPRDTILDFCYTNNATIVGPAPTDNCYVRSLEWTANGATPASGTGQTPTITFTRPVLNDTTYTITWTVTDSAGFTNMATQSIVIYRPMRINLVPANQDFCSATNASFSIAISGGTGSYDAPVITPAGSWNDPESDGTGTFSTSSLELGSETNISVTFEDNTVVVPGGTVGGCQVTTIFTNGTDYTIHQNISTNPLQRIP